MAAELSRISRERCLILIPIVVEFQRSHADDPVPIALHDHATPQGLPRCGRVVDELPSTESSDAVGWRKDLSFWNVHSRTCGASSWMANVSRLSPASFEGGPRSGRRRPFRRPPADGAGAGEVALVHVS